MHSGRMTAASFAAWATGEGATSESGRALGRLLVGRLAGRGCDAVVSKKLLAKAEEVCLISNSLKGSHRLEAEVVLV